MSVSRELGSALKRIIAPFGAGRMGEFGSGSADKRFCQSSSILQRRKEIGVRIALGADQQDISRLVFQNGMTPVAIGLALGILAACFFPGSWQAFYSKSGPWTPQPSSGRLRYSLLRLLCRAG